VPVSPCHPHPLIPAPARRLRAGVKFLLLDLPLYRTRYRSVPLANFIEISLFLVRVFDPLHCNLAFSGLTTLYGWPFKSELYSETLTGKPIVMSIGNFDYTGGLRLDSTVLKEYRGEFPQDYSLNPGDLIVVMTCQTAGGEILGVPARIPADDRTYLHNQRLGKVVVRNRGRVEVSFLYWLFLSPALNRELVNSATGTKILHTAPSRIESFKFALPGIEEQRRIADTRQICKSGRHRPFWSKQKCCLRTGQPSHNRSALLALESRINRFTFQS
jgi:hypothetical protein